MKKFFFIFFTLFSLNCFAQLDKMKDYRYCGVINKDPYGKPLRDKKVLIEFQKLYPCPSTGRKFGSCNGWSIDHVIPLACGGCDSVSNLQWLPNDIKSCSGSKCKDRFEREVYQTGIVNKYCKNKIQK